MKTFRSIAMFALMAGLAAVASAAAVFGVDVPAIVAAHPDVVAGLTVLAFAGELKIEEIKGQLKEAMQDATKDLRDQQTEFKKTVDTALGEIKEFKTITGKTADELKKLGEQGQKAQTDLLELQQKMDKVTLQTQPAAQHKSIGQIVVESEEWKAAGKASKPEMQPVMVGSFKTAIVNATLNGSQPLVAPERAPMVNPATQPLSVRDLLPTMSTGSNLIQFAREGTFTNNAAIQYSSPNYENVTKAESAITFTLAEASVQTLAHFIPASRQVLSDAGMLRGYIEERLMYGLKLEEEDEILNGDGTAGHLNGLMTQATAYAGSGAVSADTKLDTLLRALTQCFTGSYFNADGILMNPSDWMALQLIKDTTGRYIFGDPMAAAAPRVWGTRVVPSLSIAATRFLVGAFRAGAAIWDREDATIRIAEQHSDFFIKNMVAILAEERLALTVYRPTAFIRGNFVS
jgi:HK97 family phage major capsid protein